MMAKKSELASEPKFPYTTEPKALRRLLAEIPKRPKPPKVTLDTLKSWNVSKNSNSVTAIRVLKKIGLLDEGAVPNASYVDFMKTGTGPLVLADKVRSVYEVLFQNSIAPQKESDDELKKLFHIHTGGGDDAMRLQIQTFKALAEYASFDGKGGVGGKPAAASAGGTEKNNPDLELPPVQVALHIHLPENKTTRDYEAIIQDIAKYIYGRKLDNN
jgi:hypothetical protein